MNGLEAEEIAKIYTDSLGELSGLICRLVRCLAGQPSNDTCSAKIVRGVRTGSRIQAYGFHTVW
jgi:hypothetical protein